MIPKKLTAISEFSSSVEILDCPPTVLHQLRQIILDTTGAILAGSQEPELKALAAKKINQGGVAYLIGFGCLVNTETAAFLNGTSGTFLEMDEGNRFSRGHPSIHVLPAVLALCQERGLGVIPFLNGLLAGYEVGSRLGAATKLRPSMHPHGTWGTVGAAAGCARAIGLDASSSAEVINISTSLTLATSKKTMLEGGLVRNTYAGMSNKNGLLALDLMQSGFSSEQDGLASVFGEVVSETFNEEEFLRELGSEWHILQNYFKLHSCCRYNHATLDAIDLLNDELSKTDVSKIERIEVSTYNLAAELKDAAPRNTLAAKFSIPFAVATRLINGHSKLSSFTWESIRNPKIIELAAKVNVSEDPSMTARLPTERPATVKIHRKNLPVLVGSVSTNKGDDADPYQESEIHEKFLDLAQRVWPHKRAQLFLDTTIELFENAQSLNQHNWSRWLELLGHGV
jgi:2-methylcitrate dehydratase PrpD